MNLGRQALLATLREERECVQERCIFVFLYLVFKIHDQKYFVFKIHFQYCISFLYFKYK